MNRYENHLLRGYGFKPFPHVYKREVFYQSGRGFSGIFTGLIKYLTPFLISSGKFLSNEAARASKEILTDVASRPLTELLKEQKKKTLTNVLTKSEDKLKQLREDMKGSGLKIPIKRKRLTNKYISSTLPLAKRRKKVEENTVKKKRTKHISKEDFLKKFSLV
jgi:hypothetical protein